MNVQKQASVEILSPEGRIIRQPVIETSRPQHPVKYAKKSLDRAPIDDNQPIEEKSFKREEAFKG